MLEIKVASDSDSFRWDEFVRAHENTTYNHLFGWRGVIEEIYGMKPFYLMALEKGEKVRGVLPVFEIKTLFGGQAACSIPFCNYGSVCARDDETENALLDAAGSMVEDKKWSGLELRSLKPWSKPYGQVDLENVTHLVQLPVDPDLLWKKLGYKTRRRVLKAEKNGIKVVICRDKVEDFHQVYSENMRDLGTPSHSVDFFRRVLEVFPRETSLIMLYLADKPVGGMFVFHFRDLVIDPWASSLRKYFDLLPNYLLYWEAFRYAISLGAKYRDLGRSQWNSGPFKFKAKWSSVPHQLYYLNLGRDPGYISRPYKKYLLKKISSVYRHLPLPLSRAVGPKLRKFLP